MRKLFILAFMIVFQNIAHTQEINGIDTNLLYNIGAGRAVETQDNYNNYSSGYGDTNDIKLDYNKPGKENYVSWGILGVIFTPIFKFFYYHLKISPTWIILIWILFLLRSNVRKIREKGFHEYLKEASINEKNWLVLKIVLLIIAIVFSILFQIDLINGVVYH
jgi:hypothetical protein